MASESERTDCWGSVLTSTSGSLDALSPPTHPQTAGGTTWTPPAVHRRLLGITPHTWNHRTTKTGSGNNSRAVEGGSVETDDNANWTKESDSLTSPPPPEMTSEATLTGSSNSESVFSDIDYHVVRSHVMQGDIMDDHVITGADRQSKSHLQQQQLDTR